MQATGARVLLPCSEDIEVVLRHQELLPDDILLAAPDIENWAVAEDKFEYLSRVKHNGVAVPEARTVERLEELEEAADELGFPLFIKVRNGNGSRGVVLIREQASLRPAFEQVVEEYQLPVLRWPILQERIAGTKYQMDGVFANGQTARDGVYEILRAKGSGLFGTSTYRVTVSRPDIQEAAHKAMSALSWHGIFNLDWLCDSDQTPYLIDINGRLGGAVSILYEAGLDLPWFWYQLAVGRSGFAEAAARPGVATKWLLGEILAVVEHCASGDFRGAMRVFARNGPKVQAFDDLIWRDPAPFLFEVMDYVAKFAGSRGSLRPTVKGMVR